MKHIILGAGDLGQDIYERFSRDPRLEVVLWSRSTGKVLPDCINELPRDAHVWYCVGAGSVEFAANHPKEAMDVHLNWPKQIAERVDCFTYFSSDYVRWTTIGINEDGKEGFRGYPVSLYEQIKREALTTFLEKEGVRVFSIGGLYGKRFPEKCLAGKIIDSIIANSSIGVTTFLPINTMIPTPTDFLADYLYELRMEKSAGHTNHFFLRPGGTISIYELGLEISKRLQVSGLRREIRIRPRMIDHFRPVVINGNNLLPQWDRLFWPRFDLWYQDWAQDKFDQAALQYENRDETWN